MVMILEALEEVIVEEVEVLAVGKWLFINYLYKQFKKIILNIQDDLFVYLINFYIPPLKNFKTTKFKVFFFI
ncbi:hypothetical protein AXF41_13435 [Clostridium haemolyticum]|nr:hypothetical protein AXF41_13435 [Clostridium haemolyticum]